jgi:hypothetical protein
MSCLLFGDLRLVVDHETGRKGEVLCLRSEIWGGNTREMEGCSLPSPRFGRLCLPLHFLVLVLRGTSGHTQTDKAGFVLKHRPCLPSLLDVILD